MSIRTVSLFSLGDVVDEAKADRSELISHSFIVKIWIEETLEEAGKTIWRGYITDVPSGERRYLKELYDVTDFIASYLEGMGIRFGTYRWLRKLQKWPQRLKAHR